MPSVVEMSYPDAMTLPYFDVHWIEFGPASPERFMPRGKTHRLVPISTLQSIDRAVITSLMVETNREAWHEVVKRAQQTGTDGFELNFGCPHGMSERNMGSAVGQVPEYVEMITSWVKEVSEIPVLVFR